MNNLVNLVILVDCGKAWMIAFYFQFSPILGFKVEELHFCGPQEVFQEKGGLPILITLQNLYMEIHHTVHLHHDFATGAHIAMYSTTIRTNTKQGGK